MATVHDVARDAGVSISTVSRSFDPRSKISPATRARVLATAERLGYRPHPVARGLRTGRTHAVGLLVPDLGNPFFAAITKAVQARARAEGYEVFVADSDEDADVEPELIRALATRTDGLLVASPRADAATLREALDGVTAVLLNRELPPATTDIVPGIPAVTLDDADGVAQVLGHLSSLGHRTAGIAAGPTASWSSVRRVEGLHAAAERWGVRLMELGEFRPHFAGGTQAADHALAGGVTAVVVFNDLMALGVLDRLRQRGVDVPGEMSVVGYDDVPLATLVTPALTTVRVPLDRLGRRAVDLLLARLSGTAATSAQLPVELVIRGSAGPAPARKSPA
ncbi:LacI family DNA-binding transcriptional regulator [Myceligenerans pegani]|uniref:LacI family DNA-binding transcriptional regulator n=1 Tax=Myceligenerans pegani TaxID=2776917 RepID=A0ABR9N507_9MICO|nr:LacI family DNA-binding transcriptional regulator [Myceligenerans sp. TRM 65318]MBE1878757.1 LacI family DNA-binding transcriptional regulator [Myceligenerans sp. TRM 65318]MBE3021028.1 LacI family DNA-binding transcriptional regulator [Myceligenerans sp. TRM 65318]